jgi:CheY-like chemotaxis protein
LRVWLRLITYINLPAMDGLELIRRFRVGPHMAKLPIVVTTVDANPATRMKFSEFQVALRGGSPAAYSQAVAKLQ